MRFVHINELQDFPIDKWLELRGIPAYQIKETIDLLCVGFLHVQRVVVASDRGKLNILRDTAFV